MTYADFSVLAVVPARGGSKSIPKKNLKNICGSSLIAHVANLCRKLHWIDVAVISTDDEDIAKEAVRYGLKCPFMRPASLASDTALSSDVWRHALITSEECFSRRFDLTILLEPTSPLRRPEDIETTIEKVTSGGFLAAATVSPTPPSYTPHKTLVRSEEGRLAFYLEEGGKYSIRQRIPKYYNRNGVCYALRRQALIDSANNHIIDHDCYSVIIERPLVNIDEPFDLEVAEWLMQRQKR